MFGLANGEISSLGPSRLKKFAFGLRKTARIV
jgi:hypothetical protein